MSKKSGGITLESADALATKLVEQLKPYCKHRPDGTSFIEVAGSVRRRCKMVNDVDIVLIIEPSRAWDFYALLRQYQANTGTANKIMHFRFGIAEVDLYIANEETWATLLLIRTGSKENNIRLCKLALDKNMRLHADGSGLFKLEVQGCEGEEVRIAGDTEESIYKALGEPYQEPEERK